MTEITTMLICKRPFTKVRERPCQYQEDSNSSHMLLGVTKDEYSTRSSVVVQHTNL